MTKKRSLDTLIKAICAIVFCAYSVLFLVGAIMMIVQVTSVENTALLLELEYTFGFGIKVGIWVGIIVAIAYGLTMSVLAVIGVVKSRACHNVLMILLGVLMVLQMLLISGMNFSSGTIILGFADKIVIAEEIGWAIFYDFLVKIAVIVSVFCYNKHRDD